jgi:hypothetical protein
MFKIQHWTSGAGWEDLPGGGRFRTSFEASETLERFRDSISEEIGYRVDPEDFRIIVVPKKRKDDTNAKKD